MDDPLSRPPPSAASPPSITFLDSSDSSILTTEKVDDISHHHITPALKKLDIAASPLASSASAASGTPSSPPIPVTPIDPSVIHPTPKSPPPLHTSPLSPTSPYSPPAPSSPPASSRPTSTPPPTLPPDASFSQRLLHFHHCMNMERIPRRTVHSFVFDHGSPDQKGMRSLLWKLMLGYMPWVHAEWELSLDKSRKSYEVLVNELSTNPYKKLEGGAGGTGKVGLGDDPLASQSTEWAEYYKDEAIRHEIDKDVKRTYSSFHFFQERVRPIVITLEEARKQAKAEAAYVPSLFDQPPPPAASSLNLIASQADVTKAPPRKDDETHQDVIRRILFIYAKLNPGVRYVQGMNEILAPMYYVFAHDSNPLFQHHAEADAFFCFTAVMSDIRDRFIKSLDSSPSGVLAVVKLINSYLHDLDPELWAHLEQEKVDPRFYSFRWITLLLSQEFELPEVMRLWDSLFADENRYQRSRTRDAQRQPDPRSCHVSSPLVLPGLLDVRLLGSSSCCTAVARCWSASASACWPATLPTRCACCSTTKSHPHQPTRLLPLSASPPLPLPPLIHTTPSSSPSRAGQQHPLPHHPQHCIAPQERPGGQAQGRGAHQPRGQAGPPVHAARSQPERWRGCEERLAQPTDAAQRCGGGRAGHSRPVLQVRQQLLQKIGTAERGNRG